MPPWRRCCTIAGRMPVLDPTPLTVPFAVLLAAALLYGRVMLVPLLFLAAVAQGASVLNVVGGAAYGITPYFATAVAASLAAFARLAGDASTREFAALARDDRLRALASYVGFACVVAFAAPLLFEGLLVHPLNEKGGFDIAPRPLALSVSNVAQAMNSLLHCGVALLLWQEARTQPARLVRHLVAGVVAGGVVVALIGLQDRLSWTLDWPSLRGSLVNNPGYKTYPFDTAFGLVRVYVPFTEPSYLSTYCAAIASGGLFVAVFGKRRWIALAGAALATAALANSLGATGMTAWMIVGVVVIAVKWVMPPMLECRATPMRAFAAVVLAALVVSSLPIFASESTVAEFASESVGNRLRSNQAALSVLADTYFVGAGIGSNRASGYAFSLLSAVGLLGAYLYYRWLRAATANDADALPDSTILALGCLAGCLSAILLGIPDLNFPVLWTFAFFAAFTRVAAAGPR